MKLKNIVLLTGIVILALSCTSGPVAIPDDLTAAELIQRAQEASDRNRYAVSLQYYQAIIDRFPSDTDSICAAEYEIAFIKYKQKKYDEAKTGFTNLLARYNTPDEALLPPQFKVLSQMLLSKITDLEKTQNKAGSVS